MSELMDVFVEGDKFVCMNPNGKAQEYEVVDGAPMTPAGKHYTILSRLKQAYEMHEEWLEAHKERSVTR